MMSCKWLEKGSTGRRFFSRGTRGRERKMGCVPGAAQPPLDGALLTRDRNRPRLPDGPGSAVHRFRKSFALHRVRDTHLRYARPTALVSLEPTPVQTGFSPRIVTRRI